MSKPDILLIRALGPDGVSLPQGLLYIQSFLNKYGYNTEIWDRYRDTSIVKLKRKLKDVKVVGISAMSIQFVDAIYLSSMIRRCFGNEIQIIMGGVHVTALPETARNYADHVVIGDGEIAIKNFLDAGNHGSDFILPSIPIEDLDEIPPFQTEQIRKVVRTKQYFHIITARGCPYRCNFCLGIDQRPGGLRYHSVDYVIDYMSRMAEDLGITGFVIADDVFVLRPTRVYEFCDSLERSEKKISLQCFTHAGHGNHSLYKRMKDVGFNQMSMGVEHGNDQLLEYCGKKTTKAKIEQTCKDIHSAGIKLHLTYILGNLIETNETITETVDFAISLHEKYGAISWFSYMQPLPGSSASIEAEEYGHFIDRDVCNYSNMKPVYLPNAVSLQHIIHERERGVKAANSKTKREANMGSIRKVASKVIKAYYPKSIPNELKRVKSIVNSVL